MSPANAFHSGTNCYTLSLPYSLTNPDSDTYPCSNSIARNIYSVIPNGDGEIVQRIGSSFKGEHHGRRIGLERAQNVGRLFAEP